MAVVEARVVQSSEKPPLRPLLRWAGGKQSLTPLLKELMPSVYGTYHELFAGASSLFFAARPHRGVISDSNGELISCLKHVRDEPERVWTHLQELLKRDSKENYYAERSAYNTNCPSPTRSAQFIYLNRKSYNGIFRVNKLGVYNVPYGAKPWPNFLDKPYFLQLSAALQRATINCADYLQASRECKPGDFVYLDPPYPALDSTAYFTHYTADRFCQEDQIRVFNLFLSLDSRGCKVMLTNAGTDDIKQLYKGFLTTEKILPRYVSCKLTKRYAEELIIRNYRT